MRPACPEIEDSAFSGGRASAALGPRVGASARCLQRGTSTSSGGCSSMVNPRTLDAYAAQNTRGVGQHSGRPLIRLHAVFELGLTDHASSRCDASHARAPENTTFCSPRRAAHCD